MSTSLILVPDSDRRREGATSPKDHGSRKPRAICVLFHNVRHFTEIAPDGKLGVDRLGRIACARPPALAIWNVELTISARRSAISDQ